VSVERRLYCDAPGCEVNVTTASSPPYVPGLFLEVRQDGDNEASVWQFCSWDCVMRYAAGQEPTEIIGLEEPT